MVILLAFNPCRGLNGRIEESLQALKDERAEERGNCKSIYIRSRRAYNKFASTLSLFSRMATWRRATLQLLCLIIGFFLAKMILTLDSYRLI